MKRSIVMFLLCATAIVGCQTDSYDANKTLTLTSEAIMDFGGEGGEGVITYTLDAATRGVRVQAVCADAWIEDLHVGANEVTFIVAESDVEEPRGTTISLLYGSQEVNVMVRQDAADFVDVEFNATHLTGSYYGKYMDANTQLMVKGYNYFIVLSNKQGEALHEAADGATEYRFELYSDQGAAFDDVRSLPEGTYTFDGMDNGIPMTIGGSSSSCFISPAGAVTSYATAKLVVSSERIVADVWFITGEHHRVVYEGSLELGRFKWNYPSYLDSVSELTEDLSFEIEGGKIANIYFRGDYYGVGSDVYFVHMIEHPENFSGRYIMLDLMVPQSLGGINAENGILGTYTVASADMESYDYTFGPGRYRDDSTQLHTWTWLYKVDVELEDGSIGQTNKDFCPITGGTIKVENPGGGNEYLITMDCTDDKGHKVQGTFQGTFAGYVEDQYGE